MTSLQKQTCSLSLLLLGFFLIFISCNNDDASDQEIDKIEVSDIEFTSEDVSYNLLNLKWNAVTVPNNEKVVYEVSIGDTKLTDNNEDTDYIITGLEADTQYTGKIIPKTVDDTSGKSSKSWKTRIELDLINFSVKTKKITSPNALVPVLKPVLVDVIAQTEATIKWDFATISDNSKIKYNIYLDGNLTASQLETLEFKFEDLEEKTTYNGVVLAISKNQKSRAQTFEFETLSNENEVLTKAISFFRGSYATFLNKDFIQLVPIVSPADANAVDFIWNSSDESIAIVDDSGYVDTNNFGITKITATFANDPSMSASIEIKVEECLNIDDEFLSVQPKRASLLIGEAFKYKINRFNFNVGDVLDNSLEFSSSNPSIATIDTEGNVTGIENGTVAISISSAINATVNYIAMLHVVTNLIPVTSLKTFNSNNNRSLFVGGSDNQGYFAQPENATDRTLLFTSTNEAVIEANTSGIVTANDVGTVSLIITSLSNNEISETLNYTVLEGLITFDETTNTYTALANREVTLDVFGNLSLPLGTVSPKQATVEFEFILKDNNQINLFSVNNSNQVVDVSIIDDIGFDFFCPAFANLKFNMPVNGELTIDV